MKTWEITLAAIALAAFAIVGCGDDSGPTGASPAPSVSAMPATAMETGFSSSGASGSVGLTAGTNDVTAAVSSSDNATMTTVAEILANHDVLLGREVVLTGETIRTTSERDEFIFSDGTGEIRVDFQVNNIAPMNTLIRITAIVASSELDVISWELNPRFSCADVQNVRVRLSKPGFVIGPIVGLFLEYEGAPPGNKIVEITWDEKNKPGEVERLKVGEGDAQRDGMKFDLIGLIAWIYDDLERPDERQIRVNLRIEGRDGQCARVRRVNVTPGPSLGVAPRGGGNRGESGLVLDAGISVQPGGSFNASAVVINKTSEIVEDAKVAFVTPPGFGPRTGRCEGGTGSGSSEGHTIICDVGVILPNSQTVPAITVQYLPQTIAGGVLSPGFVGLLHGGQLGQVFDYVVETGKGVGVTNLREVAQ